MADVVKRQRCDVISNLPEDVIGAILVNLPTRDVIRTSILSKEWRHRWAKLPWLMLDQTVRDAKCSTILSQYLFLHKGPVKKFTLSVPISETCEMDKLKPMFFLSRKGIEDLTLDVRNGYYELPVSFFRCQQLRHLNLRGCWIKAILDFEGFSRLTSLKLGQVIITSKEVERLISVCPLLELLDMQACYTGSGGNAIEIDAPSLKTFSFRGYPRLIVFKNVPRLAHVSISPIYWTAKNYSTLRGKCRLNYFFRSLPVLEKLHLDFAFDMCLFVGEVPRRLPTTLVHLKDLRLEHIQSDDWDELSFVFCLIRSSPNLKQIDIGFCENDISETNRVLSFLEEQDYSDIILNELEKVQLKGVTGTIHLYLVEILLAKSPSLKKMEVMNKLEDTKALEMFKELAKFSRASEDALVIYEDGFVFYEVPKNCTF